METNIISFLVILIITIVIFTICREIVCWYWKINKNIDNQEKIISLLQQLIDKKDFTNIVNKNTNPSDFTGSKVKVTQKNGLELIGEVIKSDSPDEYLALLTSNGILKIKQDFIKSIIRL